MRKTGRKGKDVVGESNDLDEKNEDQDQQSDAANGGESNVDPDLQDEESSAKAGRAKRSIITKPLVEYDADDSDEESVQKSDDEVEKKGKKVAQKRAAPAKESKKGKGKRAKSSDKADHSDEETNGENTHGKGKRKKSTAKEVHSDDESDEESVTKSDDEEGRKGKKVNPKRATSAKKSKKGRGRPAKVDHSDEETDEESANGKGKRKKATAKEKKEVEYEVDKVVDQRQKGSSREFKIRWKGFRAADDTWETEASLSCPEAIKAFLDSQSAPTKDKSSAKKKDKGKGKKPANENSEEEDENDGKDYDVERIIEVHTKKNGKHEFLIRWKGFKATEDTWEPEDNLSCPDLITKFMAKVEKAKESTERELRVSPQHTERYTLMSGGSGRRLSRRGGNKQRATYHDYE